MKIGLPYMTQIRGGEDTGQLVPDEDQAGTRTSLGGWIALTFNQLVASMTSGYHTEHNDNDTHKDIHCDTISERSRTTPMGEWISIVVASSNFTASGAMTFTVPVATSAYRYMLIGKTLFLKLTFGSVTVGGAADTNLRVKLPANLIVAAGIPSHTVFHYRQGATYAIGMAQAQAGNNYIELYTTALGNWALSAADTDIRGQIAIEVK